MKRKTLHFIEANTYLLISILSFINVFGIENKTGQLLELIAGFLFFICYCFMQYKLFFKDKEAENITNIIKH